MLEYGIVLCITGSKDTSEGNIWVGRGDEGTGCPRLGGEVFMTGSSPTFPLCSHSMVHSKNNSYFLGIKLLLK